MGSPEFALPTLRALAANFTLAGVVTQPDRPAGRGRALTPPPVKELAEAMGIPVIQPRRLSESEAMAQLRAWSPNLIVVAAFGQILKPEALELPEHGCVNVHASMLPRWRGAAPVHAAILHGDEQTGVTIMRMDPGLDTGPIISQRAIPIQPQDTTGTLSKRLGELGADTLIDTLPAYLQGDLQPRAQDGELATYAPMLEKSDGLLDFNEPAAALARRVRAFNPWPGAFTFHDGQRLKILFAHAVEAASPGPEATIVHDGRPALGTAAGLLVLDEVQPAGKKAMPGKAFLLGAKDWAS